MSTIAGIVGPRSDAHSDVAAMLAQMNVSETYPIAVATIGNGSVGVGGLRTLPAEREHGRPAFHDETGCVLVADIRLDNRPELMRQLGLSSATDASIALSAYAKWGTSFPSRLLGAFAGVVWDPRSQTLTAFRDHFGVRPILYSSTPSSFIFASSLKAVRSASTAQHTVNVTKLHHFLADPLELAAPTATVFNGIYSLAPASVLIWSRSRQPRIHRYWTLEMPEPLQLKSDREYAEAFRSIFDQAVGCRMTSNEPVGSMLSGGMDSSAVVASAVTQQGETSQKLRVFSAFESDPSDWNDNRFIREITRQLPVELHGATTDDVVAEYDLDDILSDPGALFDVSMPTLRPLMDRARLSTCPVVLTGVAGDEPLTSSSRDAAVAAARQLRPVQAWKEVSRYDGRSIPTTSALRSMLALLLPRRLREFRRANPQHTSDFRLRLNDVGLTDPAIVDELTEDFRSLVTNPDWNTSNPRFDRIAAPSIAIGVERYERVAARAGVELRHPFVDKRLVEFCLSLPVDQLQRDSWSKWILRETMEDELPASVLWRPKTNATLSQFWTASVAKHHSLTHNREADKPLGDVFGRLPNVFIGSEEEARWARAVVRRWCAIHN